MPASPGSPYTAATNRVHPRHRAQLHHSRSRNAKKSFPGPRLIPRMTAIGHTVMPRTGSSWIAVALASFIHHARCTGRALLTVKLVAVHGAGREREPSQDALMPPRLEDGLQDDRVPGDPGRSRAEGRTPARDHPADLDADRRPGPRNVAAGLAGAVQAGGPQEGATARQVPTCLPSR